MRGGLRGRESCIGLGRGRLGGWQRGGESPRGDGLQGRQGLVELGRVISEGWKRGGQSSRRGGPGGLIGSGIEPLSLITGAKKLLQDVSGVDFNRIPR